MRLALWRKLCACPIILTNFSVSNVFQFSLIESMKRKVSTLVEVSLMFGIKLRHLSDAVFLFQRSERTQLDFSVVFISETSDVQFV